MILSIHMWTKIAQLGSSSRFETDILWDVITSSMQTPLSGYIYTRLPLQFFPTTKTIILFCGPQNSSYWSRSRFYGTTNLLKMMLITHKIEAVYCGILVLKGANNCILVSEMDMVAKALWPVGILSPVVISM